jgi:hypothetical protein
MEITKNEFSPNALMYAVYSSNKNELARGYLPQDGTVNLVDNVYLEYNGTATYTVIVWWQDDGTNQDDNQGKQFKTKISVNDYETVAYLKGGWNNTISSDIIDMINPIKANNPDFRAKGFYRANHAPDSNVGAVNIATDSSMKLGDWSQFYAR